MIESISLTHINKLIKLIMHSQKCNNECGCILSIDTPIMVYKKEDNEKTLCSTCYWKAGFWKDDENSDNEDEIEDAKSDEYESDKYQNELQEQKHIVAKLTAENKKLKDEIKAWVSVLRNLRE